MGTGKGIVPAFRRSTTCPLIHLHAPSRVKGLAAAERERRATGVGSNLCFSPRWPSHVVRTGWGPRDLKVRLKKAGTGTPYCKGLGLILVGAATDNPATPGPRAGTTKKHDLGQSGVYALSIHKTVTTVYHHNLRSSQKGKACS